MKPPERQTNPVDHPTLSSALLDGVSVRNEFEASTWQAFWMTAVDLKTAADVASDLGISGASVYQAKSRVLRRLRQRLTETPN